LRGLPERVGLEREVIHADLTVSGLFEHRAAKLIKGALLVAARQVVFGEVALAGLEPGDVRVCVEGYAVGAVAADDFNRPLDARARLERQAVNQIVVDARVAGGARLFGDDANLLFGLHAVDRLLHARVEILYAEAQASEAEARERPEVFAGRDARV
jgi:hypothetical protein